MPLKENGKPPILLPEIRKEAEVAADQRCREGHGFAMNGSFNLFIEPYLRRTMKAQHVENSETALLPKPATIQKLYREICSVKARQGDEQTIARMAA